LKTSILFVRACFFFCVGLTLDRGLLLAPLASSVLLEVIFSVSCPEVILHLRASRLGMVFVPSSRPFRPFRIGKCPFQHNQSFPLSEAKKDPRRCPFLKDLQISFFEGHKGVNTVCELSCLLRARTSLIFSFAIRSTRPFRVDFAKLLPGSPVALNLHLLSSLSSPASSRCGPPFSLYQPFGRRLSLFTSTLQPNEHSLFFPFSNKTLLVAGNTP